MMGTSFINHLLNYSLFIITFTWMMADVVVDGGDTFQFKFLNISP